MPTRRDFLKTSSMLAFAPSVPQFLVRSARAAAVEQDARVLVVIELSGGNDGINTVVPFRDEGYAKHRDNLRLPPQDLCRLTDEVALHPAMRTAAELFESQRLAIVQGVGYPNPSRSHQVSRATWHTARLNAADHKSYGWIGRALDEGTLARDGSSASLLVGTEEIPGALRGRRSRCSSIHRLDELALRLHEPVSAAPTGGTDDDLAAFISRTALDAYAASDTLAGLARSKTGSTYPETELARRLELIAQLIKAGFSSRVYYAMQPGYDTHSAQLPQHALLLREFSQSLSAFLDDIAAAGLADRVLVVAFSEFGRRVVENASQGTDHGTAGPVFLAGARVRAGLHGRAPNLLDLENGDLRTSVDFRQVYAGILRDWLDVAPEPVLGGSFEPVPVL